MEFEVFMKKFFILFILLAFLSSAFSFNYEKMAKEIERTNKDKSLSKIAILPFEDLTQEKGKNYGRIIQEEFTYAFARYTKFVVTERSQVDKILQELELQVSGVISPESAKQIGKGLGADAIVTGSIQKDNKSYKIIARLVKTEDFSVLAVTSDEKESSDISSTTKISKGSLVFDIIFAGSTAESSVSFGKPTGYPPVMASQVGVPVPGSFLMIEINSLKERVNPSFGLRLLWGIPDEGWGFITGLELLYHSLSIGEQKATAIVNQSTEVGFILPSPYLEQSIFDLYVPIFLGYSLAKTTIYGGINLGINISSFSSDYILTYNLASQSFQKSQSETGLGYQAALVMGTRYKIAEFLLLFLEMRYFTGFSEFNRDGRVEGFLISEDMTIYRKGFLWIVGTGFSF